jgi:hypothetical protein
MTLNRFIFQKFIPRIYDVVHYKNFFRDHNNLVILKKRKKIKKKNIFFSSIFQKFLQLEKYSRWKINIQSIFGQHKILYKKIKKNLIFEIL